MVVRSQASHCKYASRVLLTWGPNLTQYGHHFDASVRPVHQTLSPCCQRQIRVPRGCIHPMGYESRSRHMEAVGKPGCAFFFGLKTGTLTKASAATYILQHRPYESYSSEVRIPLQNFGSFESLFINLRGLKSNLELPTEV